MRSSSSTSARAPARGPRRACLDHLERHEALLLELLDQPDPLDELGRVVGHVARGLDRLGQQPLAQVVLDRAALTRRWPRPARASCSRPFVVHDMTARACAPATGPATAPASFSAAISLVGVAGAAQHLVGVLAERRARARRRARRARELDRHAELLARRRRPAGRARRPSRARAPARSRAPRRGRAPARGSSRARRRTPSTRRACARGRAARPRRARPSRAARTASRSGPRARRRRHHACQNFGSSAPSVTHAVLAARRAGSR